MAEPGGGDRLRPSAADIQARIAARNARNSGEQPAQPAPDGPKTILKPTRFDDRPEVEADARVESERAEAPGAGGSAPGSGGGIESDPDMASLLNIASDSPLGRRVAAVSTPEPARTAADDAAAGSGRGLGHEVAGEITPGQRTLTRGHEFDKDERGEGHPPAAGNVVEMHDRVNALFSEPAADESSRRDPEEIKPRNLSEPVILGSRIGESEDVLTVDKAAEQLTDALNRAAGSGDVEVRFEGGQGQLRLLQDTLTAAGFKPSNARARIRSDGRAEAIATFTTPQKVDEDGGQVAGDEQDQINSSLSDAADEAASKGVDVAEIHDQPPTAAGSAEDADARKRADDLAALVEGVSPAEGRPLGEVPAAQPDEDADARKKADEEDLAALAGIGPTSAADVPAGEQSVAADQPPAADQSTAEDEEALRRTAARLAGSRSASAVPPSRPASTVSSAPPAGAPPAGATAPASTAPPPTAATGSTEPPLTAESALAAEQRLTRETERNRLVNEITQLTTLIPTENFNGVAADRFMVHVRSLQDAASVTPEVQDALRDGITRAFSDAPLSARGVMAESILRGFQTLAILLDNPDHRGAAQSTAARDIRAVEFLGLDNPRNIPGLGPMLDELQTALADGGDVNEVLSMGRENISAAIDAFEQRNAEIAAVEKRMRENLRRLEGRRNIKAGDLLDDAATLQAEISELPEGDARREELEDLAEQVSIAFGDSKPETRIAVASLIRAVLINLSRDPNDIEATCQYWDNADSFLLFEEVYPNLNEYFTEMEQVADGESTGLPNGVFTEDRINGDVDEEIDDLRTQIPGRAERLRGAVRGIGGLFNRGQRSQPTVEPAAPSAEPGPAAPPPADAARPPEPARPPGRTAADILAGWPALNAATEAPPPAASAAGPAEDEEARRRTDELVALVGIAPTQSPDEAPPAPTPGALTPEQVAERNRRGVALGGQIELDVTSINGNQFNEGRARRLIEGVTQMFDLAPADRTDIWDTLGEAVTAQLNSAAGNSPRETFSEVLLSLIDPRIPTNTPESIARAIKAVKLLGLDKNGNIPGLETENLDALQGSLNIVD